MKKLNRQTVDRIKGASLPTVIITLITLFMGGLGTLYKYRGLILPGVCEEGWMPFDGFCYLDAMTTATLNNAHVICTSLGSTLPKTNGVHVQLLNLYYQKDFWTNYMKRNNEWITVDNNSTATDAIFYVRMTEEKNEDERCVSSYGGTLMLFNCNMALPVICSKKFTT